MRARVTVDARRVWSYSTSKGPRQYSHTYAAIRPVWCPHSLQRRPMAQPPKSPLVEVIASALVFGSQQQKTPFAGLSERRSEYDRWLSHLTGDIPVGIGTWRGCAGCRGFKGPNPSTALDAVFEPTHRHGRLSIAGGDRAGARVGCHLCDVSRLQPLCDRWSKAPAFREECG